MSERPTGTWFYKRQSGGALMLFQDCEEGLVLKAVAFNEDTAAFICQRLNEAPAERERLKEG